MLTIKYHSGFKKDYKRIVKRGYDIRELNTVITLLASTQPLPEAYKDRQLAGSYFGCRECHIAPDWLLIYEVDSNASLLLLTRTGSHSDLF